MSLIDESHDPRRVSWVASAQGHAEFPIQNLPFGVFSPAGGSPRGGVAIGDQILELRAALEAGIFSGEAARAAEAAAGPSLNPLMACRKNARLALRRGVSALLSADGPDRAKIEPLAARLLHNAADCTLHLPATIGSFTDFFAGIHHARNGGMRRDPNNPLNPNYKYVPVAYHSRGSAAVALSLGRRRPADGGLRYRARSPAADRRSAVQRPAAAPDVGQQHDRPLLDPRPTGRAPHLRRLQSGPRRSVRHRHDLRADAGALRQPDGAERRRSAADSARIRRHPHLPAERGRGDLPCALPKGRVHPDRLWRVPRPRSLARTCFAPSDTPPDLRVEADRRAYYT